jgi:hypothetical protein
MLDERNKSTSGSFREQDVVDVSQSNDFSHASPRRTAW